MLVAVSDFTSDDNRVALLSVQNTKECTKRDTRESCGKQDTMGDIVIKSRGDDDGKGNHSLQRL